MNALAFAQELDVPVTRTLADDDIIRSSSRAVLSGDAGVDSVSNIHVFRDVRHLIGLHDHGQLSAFETRDVSYKALLGLVRHFRDELGMRGDDGLLPEVIAQAVKFVRSVPAEQIFLRFEVTDQRPRVPEFNLAHICAYDADRSYGTDYLNITRRLTVHGSSSTVSANQDIGVLLERGKKKCVVLCMGTQKSDDEQPLNPMHSLALDIIVGSEEAYETPEDIADVIQTLLEYPEIVAMQEEVAKLQILLTEFRNDPQTDVGIALRGGLEDLQLQIASLINAYEVPAGVQELLDPMIQRIDLMLGDDFIQEIGVLQDMPDTPHIPDALNGFEVIEKAIPADVDKIRNTLLLLQDHIQDPQIQHILQQTEDGINLVALYDMLLRFDTLPPESPPESAPKSVQGAAPGEMNDKRLVSLRDLSVAQVASPRLVELLTPLVGAQPSVSRQVLGDALHHTIEGIVQSPVMPTLPAHVQAVLQTGLQVLARDVPVAPNSSIRSLLVKEIPSERRGSSVPNFQRGALPSSIKQAVKPISRSEGPKGINADRPIRNALSPSLPDVVTPDTIAPIALQVVSRHYFPKPPQVAEEKVPAPSLDKPTVTRSHENESGGCAATGSTICLCGVFAKAALQLKDGKNLDLGNGVTAHVVDSGKTGNSNGDPILAIHDGDRKIVTGTQNEIKAFADKNNKDIKATLDRNLGVEVTPLQTSRVVTDEIPIFAIPDRDIKKDFAHVSQPSGETTSISSADLDMDDILFAQPHNSGLSPV